MVRAYHDTYELPITISIKLQYQIHISDSLDQVIRGIDTVSYTHLISNLEVVKHILKLMGKDESMLEYVKDRPGHDRRYAMDWTKINRELGWKPQFEFDEGLAQTIEWYKNCLLYTSRCV